MSALQNRIKRIEEQARHGANAAIISYCYYEEDGYAAKEAGRTKAIAEWESEHGPLGDRVPIEFVTMYGVKPEPI